MSNEETGAGTAVSNEIPGSPEDSVVAESQASTYTESDRVTKKHQGTPEKISMVEIPAYMIANCQPEPVQAGEKSPEEPAEQVPWSQSDIETETLPAVVNPLAVEVIRTARQEREVEGVTYATNFRRLFLTTQRGEQVIDTLISGLIIVVASARSEVGNNWGKVLRFEDEDGGVKQIFVSNRDIATNGSAVIKTLVDEGLLVSTQRGATDALLHYLNMVTPLHGEKAICTDRAGWHDNVYLLQDNTIIGNPETRVVYTGTVIGNHNAIKGTVEGWRDNVAALCRGNSLLIFTVCVAFASVLLRLLKSESCGYHIFGESSTGKSTSLFVAQSVHGYQDPLETWKTTANGVEARAKKCNDALMILDELHQSSPKEAGDAIYMIMNGKGKQRANELGGARDVAEWRLNCLSSGEVSCTAFIESGGTKARAGQILRMMDISADIGAGFGAFENIHGAKDGKAFTKQIKKVCSSYYGTPIRSFIGNLIGVVDQLEPQLAETEDEFFEDFVPASAGNQVQRAASKLAIVAMAGELATAMGLTGWETDEAYNAVGACFTRWARTLRSTGQQEPEIAIEQVRSFLQCHGRSRFIPVSERLSGGGYDLEGPDRSVINLAGFRVVQQSDLNEYIVFPHVFTREMCDGLNPTTVTKTLIERGFLITGSQGKPQVSLRLPGMQQARYYHFTSAIMSDGGDIDTDTRTEVTDPQATEEYNHGSQGSQAQQLATL